MRPLLEATSRLLHRLCSVAFPQAFAKGDVYELLSQVRDFLSKALPNHCDATTRIWPDFFNSIAKPQFLQAWRITLEFYRQRHGIQPDTIFTIDRFEGKGATAAHFPRQTQGKGNPTGVHLDRRRPPPSHCTPLLCKHFRWRAVASDRDMDLRWDLPCHPRFSITCSSVSRNLLSLRYVDNRLWISERRFEQLPGVPTVLEQPFFTEETSFWRTNQHTTL